MKTLEKFTFNNKNLQFHLERIFDSFKSDPDSLNDEELLPKKDYMEDDGEGNESWYLDVPNIEESYWYSLESDVDEDYNKLMQAIDLFRQLTDTYPFEPYNKELSGE